MRTLRKTLGRPWRRTAAWAFAGFLYLALLVALMPVRDDLAVRVQDPRFLVEQLAALVIGLAAAAAAFATSIPGYRRTILWMPVIALVIWLGAVFTGVAQDAPQAVGETAFQADWGCVATILMGAAVPALAMGMMIGHGDGGSPILPTLHI